MIALVLCVALLTAITHWPALSAKALTFDDDQYLVNNPLVKHPSWSAAQQFLFEVRRPSTVGGYYQPFAMISLMLDTAQGGSPDNLRPYHRTSLILHLLNTSLLVILLYQLLGNPWAAAAAGLLFGLHPITVETIPWIGERKTVLATFFAYCALNLYVLYARRGSWWLYGLVAVAYVFALLSKPTTTPLPVIMLLLDFWPLKRLNRTAVLQKVPLLLLAALFSWIAIDSQKATSGLEVAGAQRSLSRVGLILAHNVIFYLYKLVWPAYLSSHYPVPNPMTISNPMVAAGVIGTPVLLGMLALSWKRTPAVLMGWLIFFVTIFPAMGAFGFNNVIASDKYAYLPLFGICLALAWVVGSLIQRSSIIGGTATPFTDPKSPRRPWALASVLGVIASVAAMEAFTTRAYLGQWQNTEALYRHMLKGAPLAPSLHNDLGLELSEQGRLEEAISHFEFVLAHDYLGQLNASAHSNLGIALAKLGQHERALAHLQAAVKIQAATVQIRPDFKRDLANAHFNLANLLLLMNRVQEAFSHYREAVELAPEDPQALASLAELAAEMGRNADAIAYARAALRIAPSHARANAVLKRLDPVGR